MSDTKADGLITRIDRQMKPKSDGPLWLSRPHDYDGNAFSKQGRVTRFEQGEGTCHRLPLLLYGDGFSMKLSLAVPPMESAMRL